MNKNVKIIKNANNVLHSVIYYDKNAYSIIPTGFYNTQFWHEQQVTCCDAVNKVIIFL